MLATVSAVAAPLEADQALVGPSENAPTILDSSRNPALDGLRSSFSLGSRPFVTRYHDSFARDLLSGLVVTPSIFVPFNSTENRSSQTGGNTGTGGVAAAIGLRYTIITHWFADVTFYQYLEPRLRKPWNGDFAYSFGYDDYHPYTLSLVYSNYQNNRFAHVANANRGAFDYGTISLAYKVPVPARFARLILLDQKQTIICRIGADITPRFDLPTGATGSTKQALTFGCRYPVSERFFVEATAFAYTHGQQPWDPDFTYSFGLADYRSNRFSLVYSNYSGSRFPGHSRSPRSGRFGDGGVVLSWRYAF